jgi:nitroreductase
MDNRYDRPADLPLIGREALELDADFSALGIALRDILLLRRSRHEFGPEPVPQYRLSRLLWTACGCNREGDLLRTAPSVCGGAPIDVYVAMATGLYRFDAAAMVLVRCGDADLRGSDQHDGPAAPLELIYVADLARMTGVPAPDRLWQAALDAGFMAQNVSLFCAAESLATCMRVPPERAALARAMGLEGGACVLLRQAVGLPRHAPARNPWL